MLRSLNGAPPAAAATVCVPARFALWVTLASRPIATVMLSVNPVVTLPPSSNADTSTGGVIGCFCAVVVGCTVNLSCVAAPGVISKAALVAGGGPPGVAGRGGLPGFLGRGWGERAGGPRFVAGSGSRRWRRRGECGP